MKFTTFAAGALATSVVLVMAGSASLAAGPFEGVWKVEDSSGKPMLITLSGGGKATGSVQGMSGTWKEKGKSVVITWDTGWTTKIEQEDGHYNILHTAKVSPQAARRTTARTLRR